MKRFEEIEKNRGFDLKQLADNPRLRNNEDWESVVFIADLLSDVALYKAAKEE